MRSMKEAIPILSLSVALLAVFFGPLLAWYSACRQMSTSLAVANKQIIAPMRTAPRVAGLGAVRLIMRAMLATIILVLLVGCATTPPDSIDRLAAELSASGAWDNGGFPILSLPQTASPKEVVSKLFEMGLPGG